MQTWDIPSPTGYKYKYDILCSIHINNVLINIVAIIWARYVVIATHCSNFNRQAVSYVAADCLLRHLGRTISDMRTQVEREASYYTATSENHSPGAKNWLNVFLTYLPVSILRPLHVITLYPVSTKINCEHGICLMYFRLYICLYQLVYLRFT